MLIPPKPPAGRELGGAAGCERKGALERASAPSGRNGNGAAAQQVATGRDAPSRERRPLPILRGSGQTYAAAQARRPQPPFLATGIVTARHEIMRVWLEIGKAK